MGTPTDRSYCYVHPEAITTTFRHTESEDTQLVFDCPVCQGKATCNPTNRAGWCYACLRTIKLHTCYDMTGRPAFLYRGVLHCLRLRSGQGGSVSATAANSSPHIPPQNIWLTMVGTPKGGTPRMA